MRKLAHLSDVHFNHVNPRIVARLVEQINELQPDLVVISGDLTQRARSEEFIAARQFLDALPQPQIVVPGNHDVPLYNVFTRFFDPLGNYKKYITTDLAPFYQDAELAVMGVNTARSLTIKGGRINAQQVEGIRGRLCHLNNDMLKIIVTHHPFDVPAGHDEDDLIGRAKMAMKRIADCGADVLLAGHIHLSHIGHTATRYKLDNGHSALVVQAGTATSTRERGEPNAFNLLEFDRPHLTVKRMAWKDATNDFVLTETALFQQQDKGWTAIKAH